MNRYEFTYYRISPDGARHGHASFVATADAATFLAAVEDIQSRLDRTAAVGPVELIGGRLVAVLEGSARV